MLTSKSRITPVSTASPVAASLILSKIATALATMGDALEVPTLTLNYGNDQEESSLNLYQFGLRPEDEAVASPVFTM